MSAEDQFIATVQRRHPHLFAPPAEGAVRQLVLTPAALERSLRWAFNSGRASVREELAATVDAGLPDFMKGLFTR